MNLLVLLIHFSAAMLLEANQQPQKKAKLTDYMKDLPEFQIVSRGDLTDEEIRDLWKIITMRELRATLEYSDAGDLPQPSISGNQIRLNCENFGQSGICQVKDPKGFLMIPLI